jgi:hypothetical protein
MQKKASAVELEIKDLLKMSMMQQKKHKECWRYKLEEVHLMRD